MSSPVTIAVNRDLLVGVIWRMPKRTYAPSMLSLPPPVSTNIDRPTLNWSVTRVLTIFTSAAFSTANGVFQLAVLSMKIMTFGRVASSCGLARKMSVSSPTGSNTGSAAPGKSRAETPASEAMSLRRFMGISASRARCRYEYRSRAGRARRQGLYGNALADVGLGAGEVVSHANVELPYRAAKLGVQQLRRERLAMPGRDFDVHARRGPCRDHRDGALVAEQPLGDHLVDDALRDR